MERKPLRRDHQLVLAVVVPPDDGDDPPCKVGQGRIHAQYVRVLFLAVAAHQPRDEPVIDGIQNIAVKISDRPIDLHRYDLAQQLPGAPASPVHHRPPVFLKSSTKRCHFTWSGAKSQAGNQFLRRRGKDCLFFSYRLFFSRNHAIMIENIFWRGSYGK